MPDYRKMYFELFNKVTDVISELQQAQRDAEQLYIESSCADLLRLATEEDAHCGQSKGVSACQGGD
jgi:hypothetical protein